MIKNTVLCNIIVLKKKKGQRYDCDFCWHTSFEVSEEESELVFIPVNYFGTWKSEKITCYCMLVSGFKLSIWKPCLVSSSCFMCTTQSQYSCYLKKSGGQTDDIRWWECIILWMSLSFPGWNIRLHGSVNYY